LIFKNRYLSVEKKPEWLKKIGNITKSASNKSAGVLGSLGKKVSDQAKELDKNHDISKNILKVTQKSKEYISETDEKYSLRDKTEKVTSEVGRASKKMTSAVETSGLVDKMQNAKESLDRKVLNPAAAYYSDTGLKGGLDETLDALEAAYGEVRSRIKPYFAPETPAELLLSTKKELVYINACILQISPGEAEKLANKLGAAVISKISGAATAGALLAMVGTYGTAGTGAAIAGLSGAAATNATLAWVGGLLGGGMATGAVLTGGVALAAGIGVYKLLGSEARQFDDLSEQEQQIIQSTGFLIAAINDLLKNDSVKLDSAEAELLLEKTLRPLHEILNENSEEITNNLDSKNSLLFRQHALVDFENSVLKGFEFFIGNSKTSDRVYAEFVIAGVIYALLTNTAIDNTPESQIALDALRRMKNDWADISESQLSDELSAYEPEQLKGIANNLKGIYHELLFVDQYNNQNADTYAAVFGETNHPGADIQIFSRYTDEVIGEFQLKSSDSTSYITNHFERYPDIDVLATSEVADKFDSVASSGIDNSEITEKIDTVIEQISTNTITDRAFDSMAFASLASAGKESINIINGKQNVTGAGIEIVKTATIASGSTLIASYLFT
jgi:hypothetical protein